MSPSCPRNLFPIAPFPKSAKGLEVAMGSADGRYRYVYLPSPPTTFTMAHITDNASSH